MEWQKEGLSCSEIAAEIRKKYPDITWVSAKLEGTRLLLTVREGIFIQTTEERTNLPVILWQNAMVRS